MTTATTDIPEVQLLVLDVEDLAANPLNLRADLDVPPEMVESIRAQGILQPLVVTETDDHSYLLVAGHRRLNAAIRAGLATVPAIMRADLAETVDQVATMLGENDHRAGLNVVEEARAYQLMLDEGMSVAAIGKRVGRKTTYVKTHLTAARATAEQQDLLIKGTVTLDDLLAIEEFKGDPETRASLEANLGGYHFGWELARARGRRRDAAIAAAAAAELEGAGTATITMAEIDEQSVLDDDAGHPGYTWQVLDEKPDIDELPADTEVRACVTVHDGKATTDWYRRTDPTVEDETPGETPGERAAARASRELREHQEQVLADLATAAHLRAVHLHSQIAVSKPDTAMTLLRQMVTAAVSKPGRYGDDRHAALLGFTIEDEPGKDIPAELFEKRRDAAIARLSLPALVRALYLLGTDNLDSWLKAPSSWSPDAGEGWNAARILDWRKELADTWNYVPAPVEQQLIDEHAAPAAAEDDEATASDDG